MGKFDPRPCQHCGSEFQPSKLRSAPEKQRFCSRRCARIAVPRISPSNSGMFKTGQRTWNKGKIGYLAGRKVSAEVRAKQSAALMGANAPNWRGGISTINELERKRSSYRDWRKAVFDRDNHTCQNCGDRSRAGHRVRLNADHIKPFASHPELRLEPSNGRTLCEPCHRKTPTYGTKAFTGQKAELING